MEYLSESAENIFKNFKKMEDKVKTSECAKGNVSNTLSYTLSVIREYLKDNFGISYAYFDILKNFYNITTPLLTDVAA